MNHLLLNLLNACSIQWLMNEIFYFISTIGNPFTAVPDNLFWLAARTWVQRSSAYQTFLDQNSLKNVWKLRFRKSRYFMGQQLYRDTQFARHCFRIQKERDKKFIEWNEQQQELFIWLNLYKALSIMIWHFCKVL